MGHWVRGQDTVTDGDGCFIICTFRHIRVISVIKSTEKRWAKHAARMEA